MQDRHLFEYAVIRVVPRVEREEFLNVGVVLYCAKLRFLRVLTNVNSNRLYALFPSVDLEEVETCLLAFKRITEGGIEGGVIGQLDSASRFRWLTATRSTILQSSKVHPGFCIDPHLALERLFAEQVL